VEQQTILIISENQADHLVLSACLERAVPARFSLASPESMDRPLEALLDPAIDAVVLAHGPESEYLLRLAKRNEATAPIILLVEEHREDLLAQLRELGAQDHLLRSQLQDALVHRVLDYNIQLKEARDKIQQLSNRDPLTGALNRIGFRAHLERAMGRSERYGFNTALLYINIDQFANINDHYGEADGDVLIKSISRRLINKMRSTDSIARLGGDEFAVILEDVSSAKDVELIAEKMLKSISSPMLLSEQQVSVEASIGVAVFPEDGQDFSELVEHARSAMQQAKSSDGGRYIRYSDKLTFDTSGDSSLAAELRTAVRKNQFELHYQPRIDLASGQLVGLEALLRWNHPEMGFIPPNEFIPLVEMTELIHPMTLWVLENAIAQAKRWKDKGYNFSIAANLSAQNLLGDFLVERIENLLRKYDLPARMLELEITESTIMADPERALRVLKNIDELGVTLAIDDFGTGYSSLAYLKQLPVQTLKIDGFFVTSMLVDEQDEIIVHSTVNLAHNLGLKVVAEGVEDEAVLERLQGLQCDEAQGYHIARPQPAANVEEWLAEAEWPVERC